MGKVIRDARMLSQKKVRQAMEIFSRTISTIMRQNPEAIIFFSQDVSIKHRDVLRLEDGNDVR